jgi:hypothetical protein
MYNYSNAITCFKSKVYLTKLEHLKRETTPSLYSSSNVTKMKGVEKILSCARVTHSRNTTLGNLNNMNSNKLHH